VLLTKCQTKSTSVNTTHLKDFVYGVFVLFVFLGWMYPFKDGNL